MTRRGQGTLLAMGLALGLAVYGVARLLGAGAPEPPLPEVATPPPPAQPAPPPELPAAVLEAPPVARAAAEQSDLAAERLVVAVPAPGANGLPGPLRIHTTLHAELTRAVWKILERGRVTLGHVLVMDPHTGRLLVYVSTDPERFPPARNYPAASLVKVVTAAAALDREPDSSRLPCRYEGNPWRLTPRRIHPPRGGNTASLERALAMSNNQCFAQLAVHRLGSSALLDAIDRFGFLLPPAPGHHPGRVDDPADDDYALGKLGSGLDGTRITPLHAVQLAGILADGLRREPHWIERAVDGEGRELVVPGAPPPVRVLTSELAHELREMLVETTRRGTARRAFRTRRGPLLQGIDVAGKTGSLSGKDPDGRYEWFAGLAPARAPTVAVAVVTVQQPLWWVTASQVAAEVLKVVFCPDGVCEASAAERWTVGPRLAATPSVDEASAP